MHRATLFLAQRVFANRATMRDWIFSCALGTSKLSVQRAPFGILWGSAHCRGSRLRQSFGASGAAMGKTEKWSLRDSNP